MSAPAPLPSRAAPVLLPLLLLAACTGGPAPILTPGVALPVAQHAGSVPVRELIWPAVADFTEAEVDLWCAWRRTGEREADLRALLKSGRALVAVIEVPAEGPALLGGSPLDSAALATSRAAWEAADRGCITRQGGTGIAREAELALAIAPGRSLASLLETLKAVSGADAHRLNLLVSGPAGEPLPQRVEEDQLRLTSTLQSIRYGQRVAAVPAAAAVLPVAEVVDVPSRVGCATLGVPPTASWGQAVGMLDRLAGVGARRAVLGLEDAAPEASGAAAEGPAAPLLLEGTAAVLLLDVPRLRLEPDGDHPGQGECSPDIFAQRMAPAAEAVQDSLEDLLGEGLGEAVEALGAP